MDIITKLMGAAGQMNTKKHSYLSQSIVKMNGLLYTDEAVQIIFSILLWCTSVTS